MYPLAFPRGWIAAGYVLVFLLLVGSLLPDLPGPGLKHADKLAHVLMYASAMFWFSGIFRPEKWWKIFAALAALGGLLELVQGFSATRSADWLDMLANLAGLAVALAAAWLFTGGWCLAAERRLISLLGSGSRNG